MHVACILTRLKNINLFILNVLANTTEVARHSVNVAMTTGVSFSGFIAHGPTLNDSQLQLSSFFLVNPKALIIHFFISRDRIQRCLHANPQDW